jgi:hypothetical protein
MGPPRALDSGEHVVGGDGTAADVVEIAVVGFTDHRVHGEHLLVPRQRQHVADEGVGHARHAQGGSQQDRGLDLAQLLHLGHTGQLAEAVTHEDGAGHLLEEEIAGVRQDGGHAGAHGVAADDGRLADLDTGDVGDGIERT